MRKMYYAMLAATAALGLAGCAHPAINDIDDSHVKVFVPLGSSAQEVTAEAARGCAVYTKTAVPISQSCADQNCFHKQALFACQ